MARDALRTFGMVMDNTRDIKNIVINNFFKLLDLGNNDLLNEFVLKKLANFNFCIVQDKFISRIREIIDKESKKIEMSNQSIDYEQLEVNFKNELQQITMDEIRLEDDIRTLSLQISDKFPMISRDYAFEKISSKQEMLKEVILSTNKSVIDTLVKMTPQFVRELKQLEIEKQNQNQVQQLSQNIETTKNVENMNNNVQQQNTSQKTINLHELIQDIRKNIYSKSLSAISLIKSVNPFNEFKPIKTEEFQIELEKYSVSIDSSYVEGIVSKLNLELGRKLINKAKSNILQDVMSTSNEIIDFINNDELIQKYGINIDDKYMNEIIEHVNDGINAENQKRSISIQNQQITTNSVNSKSDNNVADKEDVNNLFTKYPGYKRLYECFLELVNSDIQKDAIEQIMKYGEYNGFKLNSMLSNQNDSEQSERNRRIEFAEMLLFDEELFLNMANNGLNCFHGTKIEALETILSKGLFSSAKLNEKGIQLKTGEEYTMNKISIYGGGEKRNFISLTDDFYTSVSYAGFQTDESIEYFKKNFGREFKNEPIIICFNGNDIAQKYGNSLVHVKSTCNEIGINTLINPSDIKCIITSYDKIEYVQSLTSKYGIDVLGYNPNNKFSKEFIPDKKGKFYSRLNHDIVIDEQEFACCKESIKENLKKSKTNNVESNSSSVSSNSRVESVNDDLSMKIAADVKMDVVFDLIRQYNNGSSVVPVTTDLLAAKYNINERMAQKLAIEINSMVLAYIQLKEDPKEYNNNQYYHPISKLAM